MGGKPVGRDDVSRAINMMNFSLKGSALPSPERFAQAGPKLPQPPLPLKTDYLNF